ncbi:hypothetical protein [Pleomorphomonas sp. JP5]|uniref:hypothetical protein n=1 Tax=Pleomorphomonas sp. JP5 TaxID=2942998 RepID=UPI002044BAA8|nr:hypothetical protein [Pleomorphomonas sp. JP5]MCM5556312.1 hypothetical protein [Pleomorphomonas sp. JP5]
MPSTAVLEKVTINASARQRETEAIVQLFNGGLSRTQIAHQMGMATSTVSDRLVDAGFPKGEAGRRWTEEENAVIAEAARDPAATAKSIAHRLPGRKTVVIVPKLRAARQALSDKRGRKQPTPQLRTQPTEVLEAGMPNWPLPPGAMRDRRGITLPRISIQFEVRHG